MGHTESKKRKRTAVVIHQDVRRDAADTSKPTAVFQKPEAGRASTLSIALPGSIIANCQSHDLKTSLAGRIARAAAVFCVDEIVIFDDGQSKTHQSQHNRNYHNSPGGYKGSQDDDGYTGYSDPDDFLFHLLSFLECPPHLRRHLFPLHPNLRTAGTLPSLDMPHHIRADEWCRYREGVTLAPTATEPDSETPRKKSKLEKPKRKSNADIDGADKKTIVDAGFPVEIPVDIPSMTRVTLKFPDETAPSDFPFLRINHSVSDGAERPPLNADAIDPAGPREQDGYYWGYSLRRAATLSAIFTESPFEDGYDVSIGTSERGRATWDVMPGSSGDNKLPDTFSHALLIFGGVAGLEVAAAADKELAAKGIGKDNLAELFDFYVNVCPGQGSRTIRTEEAVWIALGQLRSWVTVAANKQ